MMGLMTVFSMGLSFIFLALVPKVVAKAGLEKTVRASQLISVVLYVILFLLPNNIFVYMAKYFGTDGFRGEANKTLTVEHAYKIGRFLGWYYSRNKKDGKCRVVIGKDTRRSSYMFEYALASGLAASGADAYLLHVTTTPSVSYVARTEGFDCGVMISASHNPYYDNGIKLINAQGEDRKSVV